MKKLPSLLGNAFFCAAIFILAGCDHGEKKNDEKPSFNAKGFPSTIDSVFDAVSKTVRPYKPGEAVYYTLRLDSNEVNALLGNKKFNEIVLVHNTNSLKNIAMFKLNGYALDSSRALIKLRDTSNNDGALNIAIIPTIFPKVLNDEPYLLGNFMITRKDLTELTTDKAGKPIAYTHIQITPELGSEYVNVSSQNGGAATTNSQQPSGINKHPSPPAM